MNKKKLQNVAICAAPEDKRRTMVSMKSDSSGQDYWVSRGSLPSSVALHDLIDGKSKKKQKEIKLALATKVRQVLNNVNRHEYSFSGASAKDWKILMSILPSVSTDVFVGRMEVFASIFPEEFRLIMNSVSPSCGAWDLEKEISVVNKPFSTVRGSNRSRDFHRRATCSSVTEMLDHEGEAVPVQEDVFQVPGIRHRERLDLGVKVNGPDHGTIFVKGLQKYSDTLPFENPDLIPLSDPFIQSLVFAGGHRSNLLKTLVGQELQDVHSFPGACVKRTNLFQ